VGDYTSKLVAGMEADLDSLTERVRTRNGDEDTEALLSVRLCAHQGVSDEP